MLPPGREVEEPPQASADELDALETEAAVASPVDLSTLSTLELVELMGSEDAVVPGVVRSAAVAVAGVVDEIVVRLHGGGRLVYVGAGTSGRLAWLDASECEPTFSTPPGTVVALVAGGVTAPPLLQEAAEDDAEAGAADVAGLGVSELDIVVGVSASGRTPYTLGALGAAAAAGAATACVVSVRGSELETTADRAIVVDVGPELIAGSTRLKSGTAQKLVLNMLSTLSMVRLGKTYGHLMVDVAPSNEKLRARVRRIVRTAAGVSAEEAEVALAAADGDAKVAIVSLLGDIDADEARDRLDAAGGHVSRAVEP